MGKGIVAALVEVDHPVEIDLRAFYNCLWRLSELQRSCDRPVRRRMAALIAFRRFFIG